MLDGCLGSGRKEFLTDSVGWVYGDGAPSSDQSWFLPRHFGGSLVRSCLKQSRSGMLIQQVDSVCRADGKRKDGNFWEFRGTNLVLAGD